MAEAFVTTNGEIDASLLRQELIELLEAAFPGWTGPSSDLLVWLSEGVARISADVFAQMTELEKAAFKRYGEAIASVPPVQAAPAHVESIWTMIDELGHTIEAGTEVGIPGLEGRPIGFETVGDVVIPPGSTKGTIQLQAIEPGAAGNELSGEPELETNLSFVLEPGGIELDGVTSGGVDEEDETTYLNRLVERLRLLSISLILPEDFEVDARSYAGIFRAKCVKNYNPEDKSTNNPLMQCVFPMGFDGKAVGAPKEEELLIGQQERLIGGVIHHIAPPDFTKVDVKATGVVVEPGFDQTTILAAVEARLADYLNPLKWGLPKNGEGSGWVNRTKVYRNTLIGLIESVPGVERVANVELAKHGNALDIADITLVGVAPLTEPGTIEVSE